MTAMSTQELKFSLEYSQLKRKMILLFKICIKSPQWIRKNKITCSTIFKGLL
jgi:hypothetical protein